MAVSIPTFAQLYEAGKAEVQARSARLRDFQPGSVLDAITGGVVVLADQVIRYAVRRFDALYLDRAQGDDLDALIEDRFELVRHAAQSSTVLLDLARNGFVNDIDIPAGTIIEATLASGAVLEFEVVTSVFLASAEGGPWADGLLVSSVETGRDTNVPQVGTTWALQNITGTSLEAVDDVTLTSDEDAAGGRDDETDDAYRTRAKLFYTTLVRGTAAALRTGALSVANVAYATVSEVLGVSDLETYVYVADASGSSNSTLVDAVTVEIENWRAVGRPVFIVGASIEYVDLTITAKVRRGADLSGLTADIRSAAVAYFDVTDPGATAYLSDVEHEVHGLSEDIRSADVTFDDDVDLRELAPSSASNSLRVLAGSITVNLTEVA